MNTQQEEKLEELKKTQEATQKAIENLENSLKEDEVKAPWVTSQGTEAGKKARDNYFGEGMSPFLYQVADRVLNLEDYEKHTLPQAEPQVGYWYWRKGLDDVPPNGKNVICLRRNGDLTSGGRASDAWWAEWPHDANRTLIAYMLLD